MTSIVIRIGMMVLVMLDLVDNIRQKQTLDTIVFVSKCYDVGFSGQYSTKANINVTH
jgi:hypothetical protein